MKPGHARTSPLKTAASAGALCALTMVSGGCLSQATRDQMAQSDSVLAPLMKKMTPAEAAMMAADPYDPDKRARGITYLSSQPFGGAEPYLALYRQRLTDESATVRAVAARALGLHGTPEDVPRIIPLMSQEESIVRLEACRSMQRLHNPVAVPPLIDRLNVNKEREPEIRAEAACALGQYPEDRVAQTLAASLADMSLVVDTNAYNSLKTLTGRTDLPMERTPWVQWLKDESKPFANQQPYEYPVFWREKRWFEYIPFMPPVPNEQAGMPAGFTMKADTTGAAAEKTQ